jgi:hypothetical protein
MPVLGICGDSYFAATQDIASRPDCNGSGGKHFTELLAKKLNYDYFTLARGACSNFCIRLQIDEAIKNKCDFILIGTTTENRIEYPIKENSFDASKGIYNIIYHHYTRGTDQLQYPDISSLDEKFQNAGYASDTITNILAGYGPVKNDEQFEAIKTYFMDLYDTDIKKMLDSYVISDGVRALEANKIPYMIFLRSHFSHYLRRYESPLHKNSPRILEYGNVNIDDRLYPWTYSAMDEETGQNTTRRYHVSDKNQVVISNLVCDYILSNNLLVWS